MPNAPQPEDLSWTGQVTGGRVAGVVGALEPVTGEYRLSGGDRRTKTVPDRSWRTELAGSPSWPARVDQLEPGQVRDAAAEAMGPRAVEPPSHEIARAVAVVNEDGRTVARIVSNGRRCRSSTRCCTQ